MARQADLGFHTSPPFHGESGADIMVCGKLFSTDPAGAIYWQEQNTLIVSDLHLEKGSSGAKKGRLLPPYDSRSTLRRLAAVMDRYDPDRVIALGDSFHDLEAAQRLPRKEADTLAIMQQGREWYWITGNHDPVVPEWLGGIVCPALTIENIKFLHEPRKGSRSHEVAGHLHPAARLTRRGASVRRKCFVSNGTRLIVPAFGAYAGGLNVLDKAFSPIFAEGEFHVWMLGKDRVYPVSKKQLLAD